MAGENLEMTRALLQRSLRTGGRMMKDWLSGIYADLYRPGAFEYVAHTGAIKETRGYQA